MKTASILFVISALVGRAIFQSIGDLPSCSRPCVDNLLNSTLCPESNGFPSPECICTSQPLINDVSCCVFNECPASDQPALISFAQSICLAYPNNVLPKSASCASSTSVVSSGAASTTATAASTGTSGTVTSTVQSTVTMASLSTSDASSSNTAASSASTAASTGAGSAARPTALAGGLVGALGLAAMLI